MQSYESRLYGRPNEIDELHFSLWQKMDDSGLLTLGDSRVQFDTGNRNSNIEAQGILEQFAWNVSGLGTRIPEGLEDIFVAAVTQRLKEFRSSIEITIDGEPKMPKADAIRQCLVQGKPIALFGREFVFRFNKKGLNTDLREHLVERIMTLNYIFDFEIMPREAYAEEAIANLNASLLGEVTLLEDEEPIHSYADRREAMGVHREKANVLGDAIESTGGSRHSADSWYNAIHQQIERRIKGHKHISPMDLLLRNQWDALRSANANDARDLVTYVAYPHERLPEDRDELWELRESFGDVVSTYTYGARNTCSDVDRLRVETSIPNEFGAEVQEALKRRLDIFIILEGMQKQEMIGRAWAPDAPPI